MNKLINFYNKKVLINSIEVNKSKLQLERIFFSDIKINLRNELKISQKLSSKKGCGRVILQEEECESDMGVFITAEIICGKEYDGEIILCEECSPTKTSTENEK